MEIKRIKSFRESLNTPNIFDIFCFNFSFKKTNYTLHAKKRKQADERRLFLQKKEKKNVSENQQTHNEP